MTRRACVLVFAAGLSGCTAAPPSSTPQPRDYANGLEISVPPQEPFFALPMPAGVVQTTAWPDLRDVAIFNGDGQPVPFARVEAQPATTEPTPVALQSFRLDVPDASGSPRVMLDTQGDDLQLRVTPTVSPNGRTEYLLALANPVDAPIERLVLSWGEESANWRQSVTVSTSADLSNWRIAANSRPIMDLRAGGERLQHGDIVLEPVSPPYSRYWRLQFAPGFVPALTSATVHSKAVEPEHPGLVLDTSGSFTPDRSAVYTLPAPQPLWRLRITPAEANSVLPLEIEGQSLDGSWRTLTRTVAFRLNSPRGEQVSNPVMLEKVLLKAIRLRPIGTTFGALPNVQVERQLDVLVVNARGSGPFLLAWGSRASADPAIAVETLVPSWRSEILAVMPQGVLGRRQTLGGPSRLTDLSPAERTAQWQTTLVWVLLIGGAGALGLLAWTVWREQDLSVSPD
jgi:hypothetical protein